MTRGIVAFIVNGGPPSAMGVRARSFAGRLSHQFDVRIIYRSGNKAYAILRIIAFLARLRPALCYVFDIGYSGVLAAGLYRKISGCRMVLDTGDAIYELSRISGTRGPLALWMTKVLEQYGLGTADAVVVRSNRHRELLEAQGIDAATIPDGVDLKQFKPRSDPLLRRQYGLEGFTVIGILGSLVWNPRLESCYGSEVIEVVHRLRDLPVKALIIGDGTGLARLKARCAALGIEDRCVFVGRVPYDDLPPILNLMDISVSTQTNDLAGQVRTSGKLPLYLACGRFVLATQVGEAARVLPVKMLVPYMGTRDHEYPARLAERVRELLQHPHALDEPAESVAIARTHFDYDILAVRLATTLQKLLSPPQRSTSGRNSVDDSVLQENDSTFQER